MRRYSRSPVLRAGTQYGTSQVGALIRDAIERGEIKTDTVVMQQGERLDSIAGRQLGDARLWWVIAAASGIGWALQAPPGTVLRIPRDLSQVAEVVG